MRSGDGSLVLFTVLSQWSAGIVFCLTGLTLLSHVETNAGAPGMSLANLLVHALILIVVATLVSFLHLGNPVNAPKAVRNLATSWLSREILAIGLFTLSLLAALISGLKAETGALPALLLVPCSAAGLFLVWAMAKVYRIPTVPAWDSAFTPISFLLTSLSLGLATCLLFNALGALSLDRGVEALLTGILFLTVLLEWGSGLAHRRRLVSMGTGIDGPTFDRGIMHMLYRARLAMLAITVLALLWLALLPGSSAELTATVVLYLALALVAIQEFTGRILFYASYFRIGL